MSREGLGYTENAGMVGIGGGGIGFPPSAVRIETDEAEAPGTIGGGGGIGFPPSAVRIEADEAEAPGTIGGGGGIGLPPSASTVLARLGESVEWWIGLSETATNANTANKLIFRKFISPPNFGKWVIPKLGYGRNASGTTGLSACLSYQAARNSPEGNKGACNFFCGGGDFGTSFRRGILGMTTGIDDYLGA